MKRGFGIVHDTTAEGTEECLQLGQALGTICDAELLRALIAVKSNLSQFGGQFVMAAQRERVNVHGELDPDSKVYETVGFACHYQHIPDVLRGATAQEPLQDLHDLPEVLSNGNGNGDEPEDDDLGVHEPPEQPEESEPAPEEAKA